MLINLLLGLSDGLETIPTVIGVSGSIVLYSIICDEICLGGSVSVLEVVQKWSRSDPESANLDPCYTHLSPRSF